MKKSLSKTEAIKKISGFFSHDNFTSEEMKKIKRLAMKYNIKLGIYRKKFCKKCLAKLKGKVRITKKNKTIICSNCRYKNQMKLN